MTISINNRVNDPVRTTQQAIEGRLAHVWTSLPGFVTKVDLDALTCEVQPTIQGRIIDENNNVSLVTMPMLVDCPIVFPHAGGASLTFPVKPGDEVLVVFASRGIDFWWQSGGIQPPQEVRMHDLSDGFAIPGVWSQPKRIPNVSADSVQLRSDDKQAYIEINVGSKDINLVTPANVSATVGGNLTATISGSATITANGGTTITSPTVTINGNLILNGSLTSNAGSGGASGATITGKLTTTGDVVAAGISLDSHVHGGVQSGGSSTTGPR